MTREELSQVLGEVEDRYILEGGEPFRSWKSFRWSSRPRPRARLLAACLAAVLLSGSVLYSWGKGSPGGGGGEEPQAGGQPGYAASERPDAQEEFVQAGRPALGSGAVELVVNQVREVMELCLDMDVQLHRYDQLDEAARTAFSDTLGKDWEMVLAGLPEEWQLAELTVLENRGTEGAYVPRDVVLTYVMATGERFTLSLCQGEEPLRDCYFVVEDPAVSAVNGTELVIYGYKDRFWMAFQRDGLYYDLETEGASLDQLEELLAGLLP